MPVPLAPNGRWSLDFVSDQFICGRRFRILAVFDDCTRECLAAIADTSLSGRRVARELDRLIAWRGRPKTIVSDNGTELTSNAILCWAKQTSIDWHYIDRGQAGPERLHRELQWALARRIFERDLVHLAHAGPPSLEDWRRDYNMVRPHSSIGWLAPTIYARQFSPPPGQGAALRNGSALGPWLYPCMMPATARLSPQLDESRG